MHLQWLTCRMGRQCKPLVRTCEWANWMQSAIYAINYNALHDSQLDDWVVPILPVHLFRCMTDTYPSSVRCHTDSNRLCLTGQLQVSSSVGFSDIQISVELDTIYHSMVEVARDSGHRSCPGKNTLVILVLYLTIWCEVDCRGLTVCLFVNNIYYP